MSFHVNLREYFFYYLLLIFILIAGAFSYFRFMVHHDYIVYYEGECNPTTQSCFVGCKDDECNSKYFYSEVQKYAPDLLKACGSYVDSCAEANICLVTDQDCSVTYCDTNTSDTKCSISDLIHNVDPTKDTETLLENDNLK